MNKRIDKEFFIVYKENPIEFYNSAIGVNELAELFNRSRSNMLRSLRRKYIKYNNEKYVIIREQELQKSKTNIKGR